MLLLDEIKYYKAIGEKIDGLVKNYYNKVIVCDGTYKLLSWHILKNNDIMIMYTFNDHYDVECWDDVTVTVEQLNEYA